MDYTQKINTIKTLTNDNKNSQFICDKLKIPKYDFYNICNREKIKYIKANIRGGRTIGSKDKEKRTRRTKNKFEVKGGNNINNLDYKNDDIDSFLNNILEEANKPVTAEYVKNYDDNRFKEQ